MPHVKINLNERTLELYAEPQKGGTLQLSHLEIEILEAQGFTKVGAVRRISLSDPGGLQSYRVLVGCFDGLTKIVVQGPASESVKLDHWYTTVFASDEAAAKEVAQSLASLPTLDKWSKQVGVEKAQRAETARLRDVVTTEFDHLTKDWT